MAYKSKFTEEELAEAKAMYMEFVPPSQIAKKYGVNKSSIHYWIKKEWKAERELMRAELFEKMSKSKRVEFTSMTEATITILKRALTDLSKREASPSMNEARMASDILGQLDKIMRLDDNKPTDIVSEEKVLSVKDLQKKISVDPFSKPVEVEYNEVKGEEDEEVSN